MSAIELSGVTKRYGPVTALADLDLTVEEGEVFGFLGPNGAGKSTTIDVLLDFVRPTTGTARVLGMDAEDDSVAIRRRLGVLPDGYRLYDGMTGREHVRFAVKSKGVDERPAALLERVGIADAADRSAGGYSKGMKQRLMLAMALAGDPDLLILDEPTTGLDPNGARAMREIIRAENERGATVFFSSHVLEQVEAVCDRVAVLNRGRLVALDTIDALRETRGGGTRLTLALDTVPEGLADRIRDVAGVHEVAVEGTTVTVRTDDGRKAAVIRTVEDAGATVEDFEVSEASLEELFASLTDAPALSGAAGEAGGPGDGDEHGDAGGPGSGTASDGSDDEVVVDR